MDTEIEAATTLSHTWVPSKTITIMTVLSVVGICTLIGYALPSYVDHSNLIMIYLLGVVYAASVNCNQRIGGMLTAFLSTLAFDFFFIPPYYSFNVSDLQYVFTLVVMMIISQIISHLTAGVHRHRDALQKSHMAAETERLRNILLTSISHDMRTPLTIIMGSASTLLEGKDHINPALQREFYKNIYDESKRLNNIVTNVLQIIRLEAGHIKLNKQLLPIDDLINNFIENLPDADHSIVLKTSAPLIPVQFDPVLMEQVLGNIIQNAIKHSPKQTTIEIFIRRRERDVLIKIRDTGPGIAEEDLAYIFDKFYRARKMSPETEGFGLGLAICKHIINAHGGQIWAENHKDGGAMLYFTLPLG